MDVIAVGRNLAEIWVRDKTEEWRATLTASERAKSFMRNSPEAVCKWVLGEAKQHLAETRVRHGSRLERIVYEEEVNRLTGLFLQNILYEFRHDRRTPQ